MTIKIVFAHFNLMVLNILNGLFVDLVEQSSEFTWRRFDSHEALPLYDIYIYFLNILMKWFHRRTIEGQ